MPTKPTKPEAPISPEDFDRHIRDYLPISPAPAVPGFVRAEVVVTTDADEDVDLRFCWPPSRDSK
jgi:hypothetical protein